MCLEFLGWWHGVTAGVSIAWMAYLEFNHKSQPLVEISGLLNVDTALT